VICYAEATMQQFDIASFNAQPVNANPPDANTPAAELLRQILEVQKQHLAHAQAWAAANDPGARWRALVARWREDFPDLPDSCREVLPTLERAYGSILMSLVEELRQQGNDALDSEFAMQDFLDRYGMRLGQLGNILNLVSPLAEAGPPQNETS
jgi:hypothetical protein